MQEQEVASALERLSGDLVDLGFEREGLREELDASRRGEAEVLRQLNELVYSLDHQGYGLQEELASAEALLRKRGCHYKQGPAERDPKLDLLQITGEMKH